MIKFTGMAAVMLMSFCCAMLTAAENLLPAVREAKGFWYQARNSEASVKYSCDEKTGTFKLESVNETGYVNYRCDLKLAPGTYTVDLLASGSCDKKSAVGLEVYSFNAQGKARAIGMNYFPSGKFASERKVATFVVPSDSVSQRFGLCLNYKGRVEFVKPALYKGKLAEGDLPPRKGVKKSNKLVANHNTWVADWVWVKNANSISKASFVKKFTVDKPIVAAMVQLTADNGYELKVNDQFVGADGDWKTVEKYDIASLLKNGENSIELIGENFDGVGAVLLQGQLWFADGSTLDLLTGPDWDLYIKGKLANEEKVIIGKFPIEPWTLLPFERLAPMESIALPVIKSVDKVAAGEIFTLKLGNADKIPTKELNDLRLIFTDEKNMPAVVSQHFKPFIRRENKTLYMDLELSLYAQPGTYRWKIEGLTKEILASGIEQKLTVLPPKEAIPGNPGTLLPRFDGKNTMQTAAGEMALFTYATVLPEPQRYYNWQHTGGHMYEVGFSAGKMLPDGSVDISATEQTMMQILSGDPNAGVYIRLRIDVPGWWNARNPDEVFVSDKGRRALQSFCSDKWMSDMHNAIAKVVDGLAARPVGKALSGVLVMGFRGGEFQLWGEDVGEYDCSKPARKAFTKWQQERGYKDIITLPNPALSWPFRYQKGDAEIRERFFSFVADRHADNMISLAKFFKNRYGDKYGFGLYYGYAQEHGGSWKRMLYGGHLGFRKVIEQAPLDLLSCPASYGLRPFHRSHAFMYQPDSAALFGIRSIIENDIRPYAHPLAGDSSGTTVYSMADSLVNDSRLSLFAACHGAVVRYLALGEIVDWFGPLQSINQIRKDNLRNMQLQPAPLGEAGQLAWAIDTASWVKAADMKFTEKKWEEFACLSRDTVMRSGRSVAFVTVDDLINYPGKWQAVAIPAPALLPKDKLAALEKQYGKLPQLSSDTGALVIINGKKTLANTRNELWQAIATPAALKAGINTVWYVGGNFVGTWDGKALKVSAR